MTSIFTKKTISFSLFTFLFSFNINAQYNYNFLSEHFFFRQPAARAEAMGRAYTATEGDISSIFYNPAGISNVKGFSFAANYSNAFGLGTKSKFAVCGLGIKFNRYLKIALNSNYFTLGEEAYLTDMNGQVIASVTPFHFCNTVTIASEIFKNLHIGVNINNLLYRISPYGDPSNSFFYDFGALKAFNLQNLDSTLLQTIRIGTGLTNFTGAKMTIINDKDETIEPLPIINRLALSYQISILNKKNIKQSILTVLITPEYEYLLNSSYNQTIKLGSEFTIYDILIIRFGYFREHVYDYGFSNNIKYPSLFTYGFGLQLPLGIITKGKTPLTIRLDYTNIPPTNYNNDLPDEFQNQITRVNSINFSLNYTFKKFK